MLSKVLELIASKMPAPRIIYDRAGKSPYLSRWYLFGAPFMPDGSHPFTEDGSPKPGIQEPERPFAVFLHKFHRGDDDAELHNHPWTWAIAIVLSGGYREEYRRGAPEDGGCVFARDVRPPFVNVIRHDTFHRVELFEKTAWSIFIAGPREKDWGFWNRATGVYTQWRAFIKRKRDPTAFAQAEARRKLDDIRRPTPYVPDPGRTITFDANEGAEPHRLCVGCGGFLGDHPTPVQVPSIHTESGYKPVSWLCERCSNPTPVCVVCGRSGGDHSACPANFAKRFSGLPGIIPGSKLDRAIVAELEHCVGDEPLVEVDVYPSTCAFTRTGGECQTCEEYTRLAESGDIRAHNAMCNQSVPS